MTLADSDGIAALTMRRLGQELGVEAMSLYNHVANKDDVLDAMVDSVFAEITLPAPGDDWRLAMQARCRSARAALLRHPWAIGLMESRTTPGPGTLRHHDDVLGNLRRNGFSLPAAAHAVALARQLRLRLRPPGDDASLLHAGGDGRRSPSRSWRRCRPTPTPTSPRWRPTT